ncbi:MAG TPA: helix-turn-helix domain-containing protein [Candidatus Limnocylindria bacterium]|jgi:excisionase family DNA binding protein|nr:helix-turn-helix domain-containing protein [Candidatus Limnocylindria bacterium]
MDKLLLTVDEAAGVLSIGRSLLYELLASGQIARVKVGRRTLVPVAAVREWVDRQVLAEGLAVQPSETTESRTNQAMTSGLPIRRVV